MKPSQGLLHVREELFQRPRTQIITIQARSTSSGEQVCPVCTNMYSMSTTMSRTCGDGKASLVLVVILTVCRQCQPGHPQLLLHDYPLSVSQVTRSFSSCMTAPSETAHVSDLPPVQLWVSRILLVWLYQSAWTCLRLLHSLRSVPKWWISWYSSLKCAEFSKKSTESYNELHHGYNKD